MKLVKLIYIGRHGERAPMKLPPLFLKDWDGEGLLTIKGERSQYQKGVLIHNKYIEFFATLKNSPKHIFCQSPDVDRTIDSGYCLLNGLLGIPFISPRIIPKEDKLSLLNGYGNVIRPTKSDKLYYGYSINVSPKILPIYNSLTQAAISKREYFEILIPAMEKVNIIYGTNYKDVDYQKAYQLYDLLECYHANDKKYPKGFEDGILHDQLKFINHYATYNLGFIEVLARRLTNHFIFKEFIKIIKSPQKPSFHYYSSHDSNIFAIMLGLGYDIKGTVEYNKGLLIEVYESQKDRYVNLSYNDVNINKDIIPSLKTKYIPSLEIIRRLNEECFKDENEYVNLPKYTEQK